MSLGESLKKMTVIGKTKNREDPVAQAIRNGKTPTLKEVKMSVKVSLPLILTGIGIHAFSVDTSKDTNYGHTKDGALTPWEYCFAHCFPAHTDNQDGDLLPSRYFILTTHPWIMNLRTFKLETWRKTSGIL